MELEFHAMFAGEGNNQNEPGGRILGSGGWRRGRRRRKGRNVADFEVGQCR